MEANICQMFREPTAKYKEKAKHATKKLLKAKWNDVIEEKTPQRKYIYSMMATPKTHYLIRLRAGTVTRRFDF